MPHFCYICEQRLGIFNHHVWFFGYRYHGKFRVKFTIDSRFFDNSQQIMVSDGVYLLNTDNVWVESIIIFLEESNPSALALSMVEPINMSIKSMSFIRWRRNTVKREEAITSSSGLRPKKYLYDISVYERATRSLPEAGFIVFSRSYLNRIIGSAALRPISLL